jgi:glyoxylate reductase
MAQRVYITRQIPDAGIEKLRHHGVQVEVNPQDRSLMPGELQEAVAGRDGVCCMLSDPIDQAVLKAAGPKCKIFANYAVGFNNIDLAAATERGVVVTNTPGVLTDATADLTWALMLAVARRIPESESLIRSGRWTGWAPLQYLGRDVYGATLAVVGAGRIGTAVARRSAGFGMQVLYVARRNNEELDGMGARRVELDEALREADFISLHVPLTSETRHMIGREQLAMMKPTAYLINTARGAVVDESALVEALQQKIIAGAGLDVYENEPNLATGLVDLDNIVCVPHLGSATHATRTRMAEMVAEALLAVLQGRRPAHPVNPEVFEAQKPR